MEDLERASHPLQEVCSLLMYRTGGSNSSVGTSLTEGVSCTGLRLGAADPRTGLVSEVWRGIQASALATVSKPE